jgi:hypothetical protein
MHPSTAKALADQRHADLARDKAGSGTGWPTRPGWFSRHLPRWRVSWSRTVLSPAGPDAAGSGRAGRPAGSSLVIIVSARRLA